MNTAPVGRTPVLQNAIACVFPYNPILNKERSGKVNEVSERYRREFPQYSGWLSARMACLPPKSPHHLTGPYLATFGPKRSRRHPLAAFQGVFGTRLAEGDGLSKVTISYGPAFRRIPPRQRRLGHRGWVRYPSHPYGDVVRPRCSYTFQFRPAGVSRFRYNAAVRSRSSRRKLR